MDEHDDLIERLRSLGGQPVDPALASQHLTAMAEARHSSRRPSQWRRRLQIGGAFLAGLLLGGTGLASAGALPGPAQAVAHDALGAVGVGVPDRETSDAVCGGPATAAADRTNHGKYVSSQPKGSPRSTAAHSKCGKPLKAGASADKAGRADEAGKPGVTGKGPCQGPPSWAKGAIPDPEAKAKAQADRAAGCPADAGEAKAGDAGGSTVKPGVAPTTVVPKATTTTAAPEPTTTTTTSETTTTTAA